MQRLLLVRHAATACVRSASFPLDEPLDEGGVADAGALRPALIGSRWAATSPARRARETAEAAGLYDAEVDERLRECDFGLWGGRSLAEVSAEDPAAVRSWLEDPAASPHGGESLVELAARIAEFLDEARGRAGTGVVVTHGGPVRLALALALEAPLSAFWRLEVAPGSFSELRARNGHWAVAGLNWQPSARAAG